MLQKTFSIYGDDLNNCVLFFEAGRRHIACLCKDAESNTVKAFELFQFDTIADEEYEKILDEVRLFSKLMMPDYKTVHIILEEKEALCVPAEFYNDESAEGLLNIMFGEAKEKDIYTQRLGDKIILSRAIGAKIIAITKYFPGADQVHKFYAMLKEYTANKNLTAANEVCVVFYPDHILLMAWKENNLQIIRSADYQTPEDVLYMILNVCEQYGMPVHDTKVNISGMVDKQSNLYRTLYQYLRGLEIHEPDESNFSAEGFKEYPLHFFTPFVRLIV